MNKPFLLVVSILSVFILCSLSYQPIIADTPMEPISIVKESKAYNLNMDELKELYAKLLELKFQTNDDCGCGDTTDWNFPIICDILGVIAIIGVFLFMTILPGLGKIIFGTAFVLGEIFNCPWVYKMFLHS